MPDIDPSYASPNIRWALLLTDFPGAEYSFRSALGSDIGVPEHWGGDEEHVIATITFPAHTQRAPIEAAKAVAEALTVDRWTAGRRQKVTLDRSSEEWERVCTIALGRALKRAGYPPNMNELKAVMVWRRRLAEIDAVQGGYAPAGQLTTADADKALAAASAPAEEAAVIDADSVAAAGAEPAPPSPPDPRAETIGKALDADPSAASYVGEVEEMVTSDGMTLDQLVEQVRQAIGRHKRDMQATIRDRLAPFGIAMGSPKTVLEATVHLALIMGIEAEYAAASVAAGEGEEGDGEPFEGEGYGA